MTNLHLLVNPYDISIIIILIFFSIRGFLRGVLIESVSVFNLFISFFIAYLYSTAFSKIISGILGTNNILSLLGFPILFVLAYISINIVIKLLKPFLAISMAGHIDKILGSLFGFLKGLILLSFMFLILTIVNVSKKIETKTVLFPYITTTSQILLKSIPQKVRNNFIQKIDEAGKIITKNW